MKKNSLCLFPVFRLHKLIHDGSKIGFHYFDFEVINSNDDIMPCPFEPISVGASLLEVYELQQLFDVGSFCSVTLNASFVSVQ